MRRKTVRRREMKNRDGEKGGPREDYEMDWDSILEVLFELDELTKEE